MSKRLCTICARGGSKGLKGKNIRLLLNKPLIAHSISQAKNSETFDAVAVSSDSEIILNVAREFNPDFIIKRPPELATDRASKLPAIRHCMQTVEKLVGYQYDIVVDLDATSPLRKVSDIQEAVKLLDNNIRVSNVITGCPARRSPYFNLVEVDDSGIATLSKLPATTIFRRQDSPKCYDMNASIYVWRRHILLNNDSLFLEDTALYIMPPDRSIDIDSELDFEFVEFLSRKRGSL